MQKINIRSAKTNLSRLVEEAAKGNAFIIAKAGKPMVAVVPYTESIRSNRRIGFLKGQTTVPKNFDTLGSAEISTLFETADLEGMVHTPELAPVSPSVCVKRFVS
jgi:prevent-host-death family protein